MTMLSQVATAVALVTSVQIDAAMCRRLLFLFLRSNLFVHYGIMCSAILNSCQAKDVSIGPSPDLNLDGG